MLKLFTLAPGETARKYFVEQIIKERASRGYSYRQQVLVLPSGELMTRAREEGQVSCVGLDFLASTLLNSQPSYRQYKQLNRRNQELLVQRILEAREAELKEPSYFASIVHKRGFIKAFTSLIGQLRRSNVTPEELELAFELWEEENASGNTAKNTEVVHVFRQYVQELKKEHWYDLEGKYGLALALLEQDKLTELPWKQIFVSDFNALEPLQLTFLQKLGQYTDIFVGLNYDQKREKISRAVEMTYSALGQEIAPLEPVLQRTPVLAYLAHNLWRQPLLGKAPAIKQAELRLWEFTSRENEIKAVLTDIKELLVQHPEVKPQDIGVTMRNLGDYNGLKRWANEYGIPLTLPDATPLKQQVLVAWVQKLLQINTYQREGWENFLELLHNAFTRLLSTADVEAVEKLQEHYYFKSVNHFWQIVEEREAAADADAVQQLCQSLFRDSFLQQVKAFLEELPKLQNISDYTEKLLELLKALNLEKTLGAGYREGKLSLEAVKLYLLSKQKLEDILKRLQEDYELCGWQERAVSLTEFTELFTEAVEGQQLVLAPGDKAGVVVLNALVLQGLSFPYLYVLGLREGEFPGKNNEDWFYNNSEREHLARTGTSSFSTKTIKRKYRLYNKEEQNTLTYDMGIEMPDTMAAYDQENFIFAMVIAQATQRLTLSYHRDDVAGPSAYVGDVKKLFPDLEVQIWNIGTKAIASTSERNALGELCPAAELDSTLVQALQADAHRQAGKSVYSGTLFAKDLRQQVSQHHNFSASSLKLYAQCPFQYMVAKIWQEQGLQPVNEFVDAATLGGVLHKTVELLVNSYKDEPLTNLAGDEEACQEVLKERLEQYLTQAAAKYDLDKNPYYDSEKKYLQDTLLRWLNFEWWEQLGARGYHPLATELKIDHLPFKLTASDGQQIKFLLNGSLDRVDVNRQGELFISDYKMSSVPKQKDLTTGLDLQMPIYILAAARFLAQKDGRLNLPKYLQTGAEAVTCAQSVAGAGYLSFNDSSTHQVKRSDRVEIKAPEPPKYNKNGTLSKNQPKNDKTWEKWQAKFETLLADYVEAIYAGDFDLYHLRACNQYCPLQEVCRVKLLTAKEEEDHE